MKFLNLDEDDTFLKWSKNSLNNLNLCYYSRDCGLKYMYSCMQRTSQLSRILSMEILKKKILQLFSFVVCIHDRFIVVQSEIQISKSSLKRIIKIQRTASTFFPINKIVCHIYCLPGIVFYRMRKIVCATLFFRGEFLDLWNFDRRLANIFIIENNTCAA